MDKLRNIKNRLSVSVDKLSPSRRSKSQQRQSEPLGNVLSSEGDIPGSVRISRADDRPSSAIEITTSAGSRSRPSSYCEVDMDESLSEECLRVEDIACAVTYSKTSPKKEVKASSSLGVDHKPLKRSTPTIQGDSLMSEVMKEVEKLSEQSESVEVKRPKKEVGSVDKGTSSVDGTQQEAKAKAEDDRPMLYDPGLSKSEETLVAVEEVGQRDENGRTNQDGTFDAPSACRTESLTSGYFSDSDFTLSDGRCDSGCLKSPLRISENSEHNKSAFTSVMSESHSKSAFSGLKRDTNECIQSSSSTESKSKTPSCSTFANVASNKQTTTTHTTATYVEEGKPSEPGATSAVADKKTPTKKESLYSRIMRKKDPTKEPIYSKKTTSKEPLYSAKGISKEPIYAKIKPKLTAETSFQPIEPSTGKNTWHDNGRSDVVKPEPVYSSAGASVAGISSSPSGPTAASVPMEVKAPFPNKKEDPLYSKVKLRETRSNTLPREPVYSTVKKNSGSLPKELSQSKVKEHIYNTPLPLTPREEALLRRESFYNHASSDYGKVTVRVGEIAPSIPSIITINNPGYAAPTVASATSSSPPLTSCTESPSSSTTTTISSPKINPDPSTNTLLREIEEKTECVPESTASQPSIQREDSCIENNTDSADRTKLTQLVEELAHELEAVGLQLDSTAATDYKSKKEVLAKLLATYDVPRNLRRVEEMDEDAALEAEQALVPTSVSMDELRYVDDNEDNAETVYADVPDYSQDEFMIALDDENDPRYASLTRALRQQKAGGESPGKVSKRSATVYTNALNVVTALRVLINSKSTRAASVINKMGTLARPYTQRMHGTITDTSWIQRVIYHKSVSNNLFIASLTPWRSEVLFFFYKEYNPLFVCFL